MSLLKNLFLIILILNSYTNQTIAITNRKIIDLCQKEKRKYDCIQRLKEYRSKLKEGLPIEIPVFPYKK